MFNSFLNSEKTVLDMVFGTMTYIYKAKLAQIF